MINCWVKIALCVVYNWMRATVRYCSFKTARVDCVLCNFHVCVNVPRFKSAAVCLMFALLQSVHSTKARQALWSLVCCKCLQTNSLVTWKTVMCCVQFRIAYNFKKIATYFLNCHRSMWNCWLSRSLTIFCRRLKTWLFRKSYRLCDTTHLFIWFTFILKCLWLKKLCYLGNNNFDWFCLIDNSLR